MTIDHSLKILRRHLWISFYEFVCFNEKLNVSWISSSSTFSLIPTLYHNQIDKSVETS